MKKLYIVANWKSNKTKEEIDEWFNRLQTTDYRPPTTNEKEIIICPSFLHLSLVHNLIKEYNLPFKVGAQDISQFDEGAYTGEVNAKQIKEFAQYVLIGHSERRNNFLETDEIVKRKLDKAIEQGLTPLLFVQTEQTPIPGECLFVVYEPPDAISTSGPDAHADNPQDAERFANQIKSTRSLRVFYGGSVDGQNVSSFIRLSSIDGVLVGGASLDSLQFVQIIQNAQ